jgi:hypothetical protein
MIHPDDAAEYVPREPLPDEGPARWLWAAAWILAGAVGSLALAYFSWLRVVS